MTGMRCNPILLNRRDLDVGDDQQALRLADFIGMNADVRLDGEILHADSAV